MPDLTSHYGSESLTIRILDALADAGIDLGASGAPALAGVDEFHLGGHRATEQVIAALDPDGDDVVVDIGCGIGGAARRLASRVGRVHGIDLTPEFVATATDLTELVGLADRADFRVASGTDLPFDDACIDGVTLLHVGMNIADKDLLAAEIARVLRPGGRVVVYDIMRVGPGEITFPVPWAPTPEWSFVEAPERYVAACERAGLAVIEVRDMTALVAEVLDAASSAPPPPATLVHLMGPDFPTMIGNLVPLVRGGVLAPTMVVARREPSGQVSG